MINTVTFFGEVIYVITLLKTSRHKKIFFVSCLLQISRCKKLILAKMEEKIVYA